LTRILELLPGHARIAIIRLRSLGDCVLTTPALEILGRYRPDLRVGVVVETRFAEIFEGNPYVHALLPPLAGKLSQWHPHLSLNFHGGTRSMWLTLASMARFRSGFAHHKGAWIYNAPIPRAQEILGEERVVHTAEHLASAMFWLGCPQQPVPKAFVRAERRPASHRYAVIHPTAAAAYKTWPFSGFLAVAEHLERRWGLEVIFIGGREDDMRPFEGRRIVQGAPLREISSLLAGASVFVGNDSGPAHVAAAVGTPPVVLFGRVEHATIWAPWKVEPSRALASSGGIEAIPASEVLEAVDQVLQDSIPIP